MLEKFVEDCLWEGPHTAAGEECEEEGAAETTHGKLSTPALKGENSGVKLNPGRREAWGKDLFKIWFSLLITLL